jgi:putative DNA primase/helicase
MISKSTSKVKQANGKTHPTTISLPPRPVAPVPRFDSIPAELRSLPQWVMWRYAPNKKKDSWTKVPHHPTNADAEASSTDAATWSPFHTVAAAYSSRDFDGIGFVTSQDDPYVMADLDAVIDATTGEVIDWAREIVESAEREGAYIEKSPSGIGFHIIGRGRQLTTGRKKNKAELYSKGRYFTIPGDGTAPESLGTLIETPRLVLCRIDGERKPNHIPPATTASVATTKGFQGSDAELLTKARAAKNGEKFSALFDGTNFADMYDSDSERTRH